MRFSSKPEKNRQAKTRDKVPLTYYRSSGLNKQDSDPFTKRSAKRGGSRFLIKFLDVIIILVILGGFIYSQIITPKVKVVANDFAYHSEQEYQKAAEGQFSNINNRNKLTINDQAIENNFMKAFPEVKSVLIELPVLSQRPILHLTVSSPAIFLSNQEGKFIIDQSGKAIARANDLPEVNNLPTVNDNTGFKFKDGDQVLSSQTISFITNLIEQSKQSKVPIKSITLPSQPLELDLQTSDRNYVVKFYLGGDAKQQAGQFLATRNEFNKTNKQPEQYLDVRAQGKIFYK